MNNCVLVTGASGAIGGAVARAFAKQGRPLVLVYNTNADSARATEREINLSGGRAVSFCADVSDPGQCEAAVRFARQSFGGIDVLVNCAGVALQKLFQQCTDEDFSKLFSVNVGGVFNFSRAVLPEMLSRHCGCIINISSVWGVVGASCEVLYSATKSAIIGMTRALAKEVGISGIRVNCVAPGVIESKMNSNLDESAMQALSEETPLGRIGSPRDVARACVFLAGEDASFITGQTLGVDGGFGL